MKGDPPPARLRPLSAEEIELWLAVASTVKRRSGSVLPVARVEPSPAKANAASKRAPPVPSPHVPKPRPSAPPPAGLERKLRQKLSRGRIDVDAAIDLHGLRQAEAHSALRHFLHRVQRDGARIVLVVTGKGGRSDDPYDMTGGAIGVLKRSVPHWLAQPELRAVVIGYEEAGRVHGGAGALYVRLRQR